MTIPVGFVKVGRDDYGPKGVGVVYEVNAENGTVYRVSRHQWVHPTRCWAWKAVPMGAEGKVLYFDTLADGEFELFPDRVDREGR